MKVTIDPTLCEGRKRCFNLYIDLFKEGPDGKGLVMVSGELESEDQIVDAASAANACPVGAITLEY
jgi:ferredoxin